MSVALTDTKFGSLAMIRGSLTYRTVCNSTAVFSCRNSCSRLVPRANVPTVLVRFSRLRTPFTTPGLDQVDDAVGEQLGVDAEIAMVGERRHDRIGNGADPRLDGRAVRDPLRDEARRSDDRRRRAPSAATSISGRSLRHQPTTCDDVDLVAPERPRHRLRHLEEEPGASDEARRVVGRHAEREVAVPVGRGGGGDHERIGGPHLHQLVHLGEVRRNEPDRAGREVRPRHVRQEVGDVAAADRRTPRPGTAVVQGVHLVDADRRRRSARPRRPRPRARRAPRSARRWRAARSSWVPALTTSTMSDGTFGAVRAVCSGPTIAATVRGPAC